MTKPIQQDSQQNEQLADSTTWDSFFKQINQAEIPDDFMTDRSQDKPERDLFEGWEE